nr:integrase, catalytic region, zinc finger, CCHC-type, peptidase aspartic, catalytic [Tanacetum cinerariifolium]
MTREEEDEIYVALDPQTLSSGFCGSAELEVGFFGGTTLAEVILVKGHELPTIVKVLPVGKGHIAMQCTQPKRPRNEAWYKDKAMLAGAQEAGQILDEEQLAFLADLGVPDGQPIQTIILNTADFQTKDLDTYDYDCDDISNANVVLMANISNYGSYVVSEVPHSETYLNDMENQSVLAMHDFEQPPAVDFTDNEIHSDSNIIQIIDIAAQTPSAHTIVPGMFKLDLEPLAPRNIKNKVEAQPRNVNKKNRIVKPIRNVDIKQSQLNRNSEPICATCKKSVFDGVHDMCLLDFVKYVNSRAKSSKKHKKQNIWKPTGHVFTEVANVVPPKKPTSNSAEPQKPELKVYNRKPKNVKNVGSSKQSKIVESKNANHSEPNHTWGSKATYISSSSSLVMTGCPYRSLVYGLWMFKTYDRESLSAHELCVDLITGSRDTNLYTISLDDMLKTSLICLLSKATKTKSWLWHHRLSHLNFGTLNKLAKDGLARGIPRLK